MTYRVRGRGKGLLRAALSVGLLCALSAPCRAGDRVIVVSDRAASEPYARRLALELQAVGFEAVIHSGDPAEPLSEIAGRLGAAAVVRMELKGKSIDVWVVDRVTDKTVFRSLDIREARGPTETIAVVAAVELLRASLMELHAAKKPAGEVAPARETAAFARPPDTGAAERAAGGAGGVVLSGTLGLGASSVGRRTGISLRAPLGFVVTLANRIYIRALAAFPLVGGIRRVPEGTVRISPWLLALEIGAQVAARGGFVTLSLGLGGGVERIRVASDAEDGFSAHRTWLSEPNGFARGAVALALSERVAVGLEAMAAWSPSTYHLTVAGREAAAIGAPMISGHLFVQVALFCRGRR